MRNVLIEIETLRKPSRYSQHQIACAQGIARLVVLGISRKHLRFVLVEEPEDQ